MTRRRRECELLKHLLSSSWITHLRKQLPWSRRLRNNMIVSNLHIYLSRPCDSCVLSLYPSLISWVTHVCFMTFSSDLPPDSKLHNLLSLASKDTEVAPSAQDSGSHLILQYQKLMLDHFSHKHHAVLPEDVIQHLLLRVMIWFWFNEFIPSITFLPTYHCHHFIIWSFVSFCPFFCLFSHHGHWS